MRVAWTLLRHGLASVGSQGFWVLKSSLGVSSLGQWPVLQAAVIFNKIVLERNVLLQAVI